MEGKQHRSLKRFRYISLAEGTSFLVLLLVAMPLKYWAGMPAMVKYVGWAHGLLFIAYLVQGLQTAIVCKWKAGRWLVAVIASLLPLGPFIFERKLKNEEEEREAVRP